MRYSAFALEKAVDNEIKKFLSGGSILMFKGMENQLKNVYPSGKVYEYEQDQFLPDFYQQLISNAISNMIKNCEVSCTDLSPFFKKQLLIAITHKDEMSFASWSPSSFEEKKQWLLQNDRGYQILYIYFSRIWPGYYFLYNCQNLNLEKNRCETKSSDNAPTEEWFSIEKDIIAILNETGITHFTNQDLDEKVPFIFDEIWPDTEGEEADSLDEDFEPVLEPATLWKCLFDRS